MNQRVDDQKYVHSEAPFPLPRWGWPRSLPDVTEGRGSGHRISANGALAPRWSSCCWSLFSEPASPSPLTKSKVIAFDYGARWSDDGAELDHPAFSLPLPYSLCMWVLVVYPTGEWAPLMLCVCEHFSRWTLSRWMCRICGGEEMREKMVELKRVSENWRFCDKVGAALGENILNDIINSMVEWCRREDWVNSTHFF